MVIPFITAVMRDVFEIVPPMLKESAYGLGATTWEVVWRVVLPYTKVGVIGGIMLGLGRALGETMAVTFVIGNAHRLAASLMAPGNSIASALANEFTEAVGDLYFSALIELGLILFLITTVVLGALQAAADAPARREGTRHERRPSAARSARQRLYRARKRINLAARGVGAGAGLRPVLAGLDPGTLLYEGGTALARATLYYQMTPPPGADGGLANAIVGSPDHGGLGHVDRHAGRHPRRHVLRRIRALWMARVRDALPERRAAVGALHRDRPVRVLGVRRARRSFFPDGPARSRSDCSWSRWWCAPPTTCSSWCRTACARRHSRSAARPGKSSRWSPTARRAPESSPAYSSRSRASAARPRRCCSPRSTTSSGRST
jgi:ABC-type phosphate transport system permease subunit